LRGGREKVIQKSRSLSFSSPIGDDRDQCSEPANRRQRASPARDLPTDDVTGSDGCVRLYPPVDMHFGWSTQPGAHCPVDVK
jgi:hypothetical protein